VSGAVHSVKQHRLALLRIAALLQLEFQVAQVGAALLCDEDDVDMLPCSPNSTVVRIRLSFVRASMGQARHGVSGASSAWDGTESVRQARGIGRVSRRESG
jgi:hypothetical protein